MDITALLAAWHDPMTRHLIEGAALLWLFSAAVHGMPTPNDATPWWYRWLYNTLQLMGANFEKIIVGLKLVPLTRIIATVTATETVTSTTTVLPPAQTLPTEEKK